MIEMIHSVQKATFNGVRSALNVNEVKVDDLVKMASYPSADQATASYVLTALLKPKCLDKLVERVIIKMYTIHGQEQRRVSPNSFNIKSRLNASLVADGIEFWLTFLNEQGQEVAREGAFFHTGLTKMNTKSASVMFRFYYELATHLVNGLHEPYGIGKFSMDFNNAMDQIDSVHNELEQERDDLLEEGLGNYSLDVRNDIADRFDGFVKACVLSDDRFECVGDGRSFTEHDGSVVRAMQKDFEVIKNALSDLLETEDEKGLNVFDDNAVEQAFRRAIKPVVIHWLERHSGPARTLRG